MTTTDKRAEYIAALRQLADYLDAHADVQLPSDRLLIVMHTNSAVEALATEHGLTVAYDAEGNASCDLVFGPIQYHAYGYTDFTAHSARLTEENAQRWAAEQGMTIVPADEAGAS